MPREALEQREVSRVPLMALIVVQAEHAERRVLRNERSDGDGVEALAPDGRAQLEVARVVAGVARRHGASFDQRQRGQGPGCGVFQDLAVLGRQVARDLRLE